MNKIYVMKKGNLIDWKAVYQMAKDSGDFDSNLEVLESLKFASSEPIIETDSCYGFEVSRFDVFVVKADEVQMRCNRFGTGIGISEVYNDVALIDFFEQDVHVFSLRPVSNFHYVKLDGYIVAWRKKFVSVYFLKALMPPKHPAYMESEEYKDFDEVLHSLDKVSIYGQEVVLKSGRKVFINFKLANTLSENLKVLVNNIEKYNAKDGDVFDFGVFFIIFLDDVVMPPGH